jgi:hypothetical protein
LLLCEVALRYEARATALRTGIVVRQKTEDR